MLNKYVFATAILTAMLFAATARSQQSSQILTGVNPRNITFEPVDVSSALTPRDINRTFRPLSSAGKFFNFSNLFRPINLGTWPPTRANVTVLPPYSSPFQPNPIRGTNPFFGGGANVPQQ